MHKHTDIQSEVMYLKFSYPNLHLLNPPPPQTIITIMVFIDILLCIKWIVLCFVYYNSIVSLTHVFEHFHCPNTPLGPSVFGCDFLQ